MSFIVFYVTFITISVLVSICSGYFNHGLNKQFAWLSILVGLAFSLFTIFKYKFVSGFKKENFSFWFWALIIFFIVFSLRSFLWLIYKKGDGLNVLCANNLGDFVYHTAYIQYIANGASFWPDNPILTGEKIRYHFGIDLFTSLFVLIGVDLTIIVKWIGLLSSACSAICLIVWGGVFTLAGYLFNGGLAGFQFFQTFKLTDYQGPLDWKSIPLAMLIPQRPWLYGIPAGLLLLISFRKRFFKPDEESNKNLILPLWLEVLIYSMLPIFQIHTFIFISLFLAISFFIVSKEIKFLILKLVVFSIPGATFLILMLTDFFKKSSMIHLDLEYLKNIQNFFNYFIYNFGILWLLVIWLIYRLFKAKENNFESKSFILIGTLTFILFSFVIMSSWRYDNSKLLQWSYLLILPYLWKDLISKWDSLSKYIVCFLLFFSGFVCVLDGMSNRHGYEIFKLSEVYEVKQAVKDLPLESRFAAFPLYNHPLLFHGRKVVLGYPGWIWSHGFPMNGRDEKLKKLMMGQDNWKELAKELGVKYVFWGEKEKQEYVNSKRLWEKDEKKIFEGKYFTIFEIKEVK